MKQVQKTIIAFVVLVFAVLGVAVFVLPSLFNQLKQETENLTSCKNVLAALEQRIQNFKNFRAFSKSSQENFEKMDALFINPAEPVNFIEFLEKQAVDSSLSIEISPVLSKEIEEAWPSMCFQINLRGDFPDFLQFFEKLETSHYLIELLNLHITRIAKEEIYHNINASFLVKVYVKE